MASAPGNDDELFDQFLNDRGHETEPARWDRSYNKKQCPDCSALHDLAAEACSVCDWRPDG